MAGAHIAASVVLWHRAGQINEEILDSSAVQLATDNYDERIRATSEIVEQMRPKREVDFSFRAANKPQKPHTQLKQDDPRQLILDTWRSIGSKGSRWIPASTEDLEEQGDILLKCGSAIGSSIGVCRPCDHWPGRVDCSLGAYGGCRTQYGATCRELQARRTRDEVRFVRRPRPPTPEPCDDCNDNLAVAT